MIAWKQDYGRITTDISYNNNDYYIILKFL